MCMSTLWGFMSFFLLNFSPPQISFKACSIECYHIQHTSMIWVEHIDLLLLKKNLIHSSFDSHAYFAHFEVYCVGNSLFNTWAVDAFFDIWSFIEGRIFFFYKMFNSKYHVFYYSWSCISLILHLVHCSWSWLGLEESF
jgi:hypothetical protein